MLGTVFTVLPGHPASEDFQPGRDAAVDDLVADLHPDATHHRRLDLDVHGHLPPVDPAERTDQPGRLLGGQRLCSLHNGNDLLLPLRRLVDEFAHPVGEGATRGVPGQRVDQFGDQRVRPTGQQPVHQRGPGVRIGRRIVENHRKIGRGINDAGESKQLILDIVEFGMTPQQAIESATRVGAELLGREADLGTVEAGKMADIIAVAGDPLKDIAELEKVTFVMKAGEVFKAP